jgi:hypothetical protein
MVEVFNLIYLGIIFLLVGIFTLFFSKDPFRTILWDKDINLKDEKGFIKFQGINYIIAGLLSILFWLFNSYITNYMTIIFIIALIIITFFYFRYRKKFFE